MPGCSGAVPVISPDGSGRRGIGPSGFCLQYRSWSAGWRSCPPPPPSKAESTSARSRSATPRPATTNPYVEQTPRIVTGGLERGHLNHTGPIYPADGWGDIIPPFDYPSGWRHTAHYDGMNWTSAGQAIWRNGCQVPSAPVAVQPVDPTVTEASCELGRLSAPVLTLATTPDGVSYSTSADAPYAGGQIVTVTATIADPKAYTFTAPPPIGWTLVDATHETYTVTFAADPTCGVTTLVPVAPSVTESYCAGTVATAPVLALAATPVGVTYSAEPSGSYAGGQSVTVTATVDDPSAYTFAPPGTGGWTYVDAAHETYVLTFAATPTCPSSEGVTLVSPVSPAFSDPDCTETGLPIAPTVVLPTLPAGVAYTVSPDGLYTGGETVTVTATITDQTLGFAAPGVGGWTYVDGQHETLVYTFAAEKQCSQTDAAKAVSAVPTFVDASCVSGSLTDASYTLPTRDGVVYTVNGQATAAGTYAAVNGSTVRIAIQATDGYRLTSPAAAVHTFADPVCRAVEPIHHQSSPPLASTGVSVGAQAGLGGLAIVAGAALLLGARRRGARS